MQLEDGFAEVNGTLLYYEASGSGDPLVLIHGFSLNHRMWDDQFEPFARQYRVIRYDVRGFGRSALPTDRDYAHADDLRALLDYQGISHAHILGLSMGGGISLHFAEKYPEAVDSMIVSGSVAGIYEWSQTWATKGFGAPMRARAKEAGIKAANEFLKVQPVFAPALEQPDVAARLLQILDDYPGWHWVSDDPMHSADPPAQENLESISAPSLIIVGEREPPRAFETAENLQRRILNARTAVIPGAGHICNMEAPGPFNEAVLGFLSSL